MKPATGFALCRQAETLGRTLRELLAGTSGPMTRMEWYVLSRYRTAWARLEQQAR